MTLVLDASAAIQVALGTAPSVKELLQTADLVLSPELFVSEVTNAFWKYVQFSGLSSDKCRHGIAFCLGLIDDVIPSRDCWPEVFSEATRLKHPAYDLFYLVTARRNSAAILTSDGRMAHIAQELGIRVAGWPKAE